MNNSGQSPMGYQNNQMPQNTVSTSVNGDFQRSGRAPSSQQMRFEASTNNFFMFLNPGQYSIMMGGNYPGTLRGGGRGSTGTFVGQPSVPFTRTSGVAQTATVGTSTTPQRNFSGTSGAAQTDTVGTSMTPERNIVAREQNRVSPYLQAGKFNPSYS